MYGKLVDGSLEFASEKILEYIENGRYNLVCNPTDIHYLKAGYKIIEYGEIPDDEEIVYKVVYTEIENKIIVSYEIEEA